MKFNLFQSVSHFAISSLTVETTIPHCFAGIGKRDSILFIRRNNLTVFRYVISKVVCLILFITYWLKTRKTD